MGTDYSAHTIIGMKIHQDKLTTSRRVKAFDHDHPEDWKYDPVTGKELWDILDEDALGVSSDKLMGYDLFFHCNDEDYAYVVLHHYGTKWNKLSKSYPLPYHMLPGEVEAMRDKLSPIGLWVETDFGIHTILNVSF